VSCAFIRARRVTEVFGLSFWLGPALPPLPRLLILHFRLVRLGEWGRLLSDHASDANTALGERVDSLRARLAARQAELSAAVARERVALEAAEQELAAAAGEVGSAVEVIKNSKFIEELRAFREPKIMGGLKQDHGKGSNSYGKHLVATALCLVFKGLRAEDGTPLLTYQASTKEAAHTKEFKLYDPANDSRTDYWQMAKKGLINGNSGDNKRLFNLIVPPVDRKARAAAIAAKKHFDIDAIRPSVLNKCFTAATQRRGADVHAAHRFAHMNTCFPR
jgi:hypothetical protein